MRLLSKLHGCAAAAILVIVYFFYQQRSVVFSIKPHDPIRVNMHRLVVFGDDWSDVGVYHVSPPSGSSTTVRDPDRGEQWTEILCKELFCNTIHNFARSLPATSNITDAGSLINSDIHAQTKNHRSNSNTMPDFKTQVQQFLQLEKKTSSFVQQPETVDSDEWTIFTVLFGLWDLLEFVHLEKEFAMRAIENSIETIFQQLDLLSEQVPTMRVVLPQIADMTFLPRFQSSKTETHDNFAEKQHLMVFLWTYWNVVLLREAVQWNNGDIFMPDMNRILMDQVRKKQLFSDSISDESNVGRQSPMFDDVVQPCLTKTPDDNITNLHAATFEKCANPAAHLFWDDIHLSGIAHELIGNGAASLLRSNHIVNSERATQGPVKVDDLGVQQGVGFTLKFPPGY